MPKTTPEQNKALVLEAFDTLFNKRDYVAAERYWSPHYIQHSAHIAPGREGLFDLIKSIPPTLKYEPGTIVAEGDLVIVHGRFSGFGAPVNWIAGRRKRDLKPPWELRVRRSCVNCSRWSWQMNSTLRTVGKLRRAYAERFLRWTWDDVFQL